MGKWCRCKLQEDEKKRCIYANHSLALTSSLVKIYRLFSTSSSGWFLLNFSFFISFQFLAEFLMKLFLLPFCWLRKISFLVWERFYFLAKPKVKGVEESGFKGNNKNYRKVHFSPFSSSFSFSSFCSDDHSSPFNKLKIHCYKFFSFSFSSLQKKKSTTTKPSHKQFVLL